MSCHGPAYRALYESWSDAMNVRTAAARRQLDTTARLLGSRVSEELAFARSNIELVENGHGIHNVTFSRALLDAAHGQMNRAREQNGLAKVEKPWPAPDHDSPCLECHVGAEYQRFQPFNLAFAHERHVIDGGLSCEACHRSHEEREAKGGDPLRLTSAADCASCHPERVSASCQSCHARDLARSYPVELGDFSHSIHAGEMEIACVSCHGEAPGPPDQSVCADCH